MHANRVKPYAAQSEHPITQAAAAKQTSSNLDVVQTLTQDLTTDKIESAQPTVTSKPIKECSAIFSREPYELRSKVKKPAIVSAFIFTCLLCFSGAAGMQAGSLHDTQILSAVLQVILVTCPQSVLPL